MENAEALAIEPTHDPQGIVSEATRRPSRNQSGQAMQLVVRYGDKIWDKFPEPDSAQGEEAL